MLSNVLAVNYDKERGPGGSIVPKGFNYVDTNLHQYASYQMLPAAPTGSLTAAGVYECYLDPQKFEIPTKIALRFDVLEASAANMYLTPTAYFPQWIEITANKGAGQVIAKLWDDQLFWESAVLEPDIKKTQDYYEANGYSPEYNRGPLHPASSTRHYRLELKSLPFIHGQLYLSNIRKEIRIQIQFKSAVVSSGSGTCSLSNVWLEVDHDRPMGNHLPLLQALRTVPQKCRYLQAIKVSSGASQTLTAGSTYNLDLSYASKGICPFIIFGVRTSGFTATNDGPLNLIDIGDINATIDVVDPGGKSMMTSGVAARTDRLMRKYGKLGVASFPKYKKWYMLQFCKDVARAFAGEMSGALYLDGGKNLLAITPDSAQTNPVFSLSSSNNAAGLAVGYIRLKYKNSVTAPLAYNTTAANLKVAMDALPDSLKDGVTWSFNQDFTSTANSCVVSLTATCTTEMPQFDPNQYPQVINESGSTSAAGNVSTLVAYTTALATPGKRGFTTMSGTAQIDAYVYMYYQYTEKGGEIAIEKL